MAITAGTPTDFVPPWGGEGHARRGGAGPQQREALHEEPTWGHLNRVRRIGRELRLRLVRLTGVALTEWYERMCRWLKTAAGSGRRARTQPLPVDTCMLDELKVKTATLDSP